MKKMVFPVAVFVCLAGGLLILLGRCERRTVTARGWARVRNVWSPVMR